MQDRDYLATPVFRTILELWMGEQSINSVIYTADLQVKKITEWTFNNLTEQLVIGGAASK